MRLYSDVYFEKDNDYSADQLDQLRRDLSRLEADLLSKKHENRAQENDLSQIEEALLAKGDNENDGFVLCAPLIMEKHPASRGNRFTCFNVDITVVHPAAIRPALQSGSSDCVDVGQKRKKNPVEDDNQDSKRSKHSDDKQQD